MDARGKQSCDNLCRIDYNQLEVSLNSNLKFPFYAEFELVTKFDSKAKRTIKLFSSATLLCTAGSAVSAQLSFSLFLQFCFEFQRAERAV